MSAFLLVLVSISLASSCATGAAGNSRAGGAVPSPAPSIPFATPSAPVIPGGTETTLDEARQSMPFPIETPSDPLANADNLVDVWIDTNRSMVALQYPGINILEFPAPYSDPKATYENFIAQNDAKASVGTVRGHDALIIEGGTDPFASNPAWVEFVEQGNTIILSSHEQDTAALERVAGTLSTSPPSTSPVSPTP